MQFRLWWVLTMLGLVAAGCATTQDPVAQEPATQEPALQCDSQTHPAIAEHRAGLASALLFDRKPGLFFASDFAYRSDWPSTVSFYSPSQTIYFRERFTDFQGRGFGRSDSSYRRFDTYRYGVGYR